MGAFFFVFMASSKKAIDISTLSLEQLEQVRDGLTDDIDQIQSGLNSLKQATHGYILSKEAISTVSAKNEDKEILIPLTGSLSFLYIIYYIIILFSLIYIITYMFQVN